MQTSSTLTLYTDGGSLNNPGEAAIGYLLYTDNGCIHTGSQAIGIASNNVAEYTALITALTTVNDLISSGKLDKPDHIQVYADSELMIKQINGQYKVKNPDIRELMVQLRNIEGTLSIPTTYTHVLREKNKEADALVKKALGR